MRFIVMHKTDAKHEAGEPPAESIIEGMGKLVGRSIKAGIFKDGAGLHRSNTRARVTFDGGKPRVIKGPYKGENELVETMALIATTGMERAVEMATELGRAAGDREIEIGPVVEGWELHGGTRPAKAPYRFLLLLKSEHDAPPKLASAARELLDRWKREDVLQSETTLAPTKTGVRSSVVEGKRRFIDGPFAESKELVSGFSIIEVPTLEDAKRWCEEYQAILGDNEVDIRDVI